MRNIKILKHFETPKEPGKYQRLICLTGEKKGEAYFLLADRIVMGRSEKADIKVLDIKSSREHAEIKKAGDDIILTDLGSQNGIVINDLKVKQHSLKNGDKIIIGKTVYKYSEVIVSEPKTTETQQEDNDDENEVEPVKPKANILLLIVIFGSIFIIFNDETATKSANSNSGNKYNIKEISDPFTSSLSSKKEQENKESQMKMNIYFQKGLREFREDNYFRAINEFNHALSWKPGDPLAEFYLRKTKEALDKRINSHFTKAVRNIEALSFQKAVVQYCAIIRLLYNYPEDERYINAVEGVKEMEIKLGLDEGDIKCAEELK